jgi:ParB family chromosome partitioning protein
MAERRPALGKGLSALIPDVDPPRPSPQELDIDLLTPNRYQPRHHADEARIEELAQSIRANGIIQPIVVRKVDDRYQIIVGERRWRAAQRAGLLRVPVIVREMAPGQERKLLEMALIENIQREGLNPMEEALAYRRLANEFDLTQEEIAAAVGKDRSSVANYMRLLKLPDEIQKEIADGRLSMGHARALLAVTDQAVLRRLVQDIIARKLSVRDAERLAKRAAEPPTPRPAPLVDVHTRAAEDRLRLALGTRVRIVRRGKGGRLEIDFVSEDELNRLYEQLLGR